MTPRELELFKELEQVKKVANDQEVEIQRLRKELGDSRSLLKVAGNKLNKAGLL